jgi:hypothetical protein
MYVASKCFMFASVLWGTVGDRHTAQGPGMGRGRAGGGWGRNELGASSRVLPTRRETRGPGEGAGRGEGWGYGAHARWGLGGQERAAWLSTSGCEEQRACPIRNACVFIYHLVGYFFFILCNFTIVLSLKGFSCMPVFKLCKLIQNHLLVKKKKGMKKSDRVSFSYHSGWSFFSFFYIY